jgi:tight adherence protein B
MLGGQGSGWGGALGLFVITAFLAVVLLVEGSYLLWDARRGQEVQRLRRRLRMLEAGGSAGQDLSLMKRRVLSGLPWLDAWMHRLPRIGVVDRWLEQSGIPWSVSRLGFWMGLSALLLVVLVRVAGGSSVMMGLLAVGVGASVPIGWVARQRGQRLHQFAEQLPDALDLMARALRAGHAFPMALQMVGTEAQDPIAAEFHATFDEINYGVPMNEALTHLAVRVPSMDLRYFVVSVLLQRETGGNLAELLDTLAQLVRDRFKLLGRVRVLSAEGRLSAVILVGLPFVTAAAIFVVNPAFLRVLWTDPLGPSLVASALGLMVLGIALMVRIVKIRV